MNRNASILSNLIEEDFGLDTKERSRWGKSLDHSSLVLDKEKGIFYWNSKDLVGDPLIYLTKVRGMPFSDAKDYLKSLGSFESTYVYTITSGEKEDIIVYPALVDAFHDAGLHKRDYWYRRGLTDFTIDRFQLGWYNGYNTIPIFVDGVFRNFQLRRDVPDKRIRSYYTGVGPLLFNSDILRVTNKVFISEGLTDCLRISQEGIPVVSYNTGALGWSDGWFKYFISQKEIYVVFDNDNPGKVGAKKVASNLGIYRTKIFTFKDYDSGYDAVKFFADGGTKDDFINLVTSNAKYAFEGI